MDKMAGKSYLVELSSLEGVHSQEALLIYNKESSIS